MEESLARRVTLGLAQMFGMMAALIFIPAGTLGYWQAWVFLVLYSLVAVAMTVDLLDRDPALVERRMKSGPGAETEPAQKKIMMLIMSGFFLLLVVPGLDHRYGWSTVPAAIAWIGDAVMLLGWWVIFHVFRVNSFTAATIEIAQDHRVISAGPYAIVRHPMYAGGIFLLAGIPIALGSWWGLLIVAALMAALMWRVIDEERFLIQNLPGYADYRAQVRWRLVPGVW
jgi:protein-S-isoprenylcysteine O-methyltransferase Ste14